MFDTDGNGRIDDGEFFAAVEAWTAGALDDGTFFALIDAWVAGAPVRSSSASPFPPGLLGAERVWIYDAQGRLLARLAPPTPARLAHLMDRWANGVYLYVALYERAGHPVRVVGAFTRLR